MSNSDPAEPEEEVICPTCNGRGSVGTSKEDAEGNVEVKYDHCEGCNGTGLIISNGDFD